MHLMHSLTSTLVASQSFAFQFPLLGFLLCISFVILTFSNGVSFTFNSLYWDFCYASSGLAGYEIGRRRRLSIPFIGIFVMHLRSLPVSRPIVPRTFNSLYWDFCYASSRDVRLSRFPRERLSIPFIGIFVMHRFPVMLRVISEDYHFQFPLLGFLLCIFLKDIAVKIAEFINFQFPLLGFLLCILRTPSSQSTQIYWLSIPFIGIFVMHLKSA